MPKKEIKSAEKKNFLMDTAIFLQLWRANVKSGDGWKRFVISCYDAFEPANTKNGYMFNGKNVSGFDEDKCYSLLSEKCYNKAIGLKKTMERKMLEKGIDKKIDMPEGYKERGGKKSTSKRVNADQMLDIFFKD
jgi:hypothetical protein